MLKRWRGTRYYETPTKTRRRVNFETCKAIYDEDMSNKINFLMRKKQGRPLSWLLAFIRGRNRRVLGC